MGEVNTQELLEQAKELRKRRDYLGIERLLTKLETEDLIRELELGLELAQARMNLFRTDEVNSLLRQLRRAVHASRSHYLIRWWQLLAAAQLWLAGNLSEAESLFLAASRDAERAGSSRHLAIATNGLGIVSALRGDFEQGVVNFSRALAVYQIVGDSLGVGSAHFNLGLLHREWGRYERAEEQLDLADEYFSVKATAEEKVFTTAERALLILATGDRVLAESIARAAAEQAHSLGPPYLVSSTSKVLGKVLLEIGELSEASVQLASALEAANATNSVMLKAEVHEEIAILQLSDGNLAGANIERAKTEQFYHALGAESHCARFRQRFEANLARSDVASRTARSTVVS